MFDRLRKNSHLNRRRSQRLGAALVAIASSAMAMTAGCVSRQYTNPTDPASEEIAPDEAMTLRQWDKSDSTYARAAVHAHSTWFLASGFSGQDNNLSASLLSLPLFGLNVLTLPYTAIRDGVRPIETKETTQAPTYSGSPPLPTTAEANNPPPDSNSGDSTAGNSNSGSPSNTNSEAGTVAPTTSEGAPSISVTPGAPTQPSTSDSPAPAGK
jgi:hypothetical protein